MVSLFSRLFDAADTDGSMCPYPLGSQEAANWLACMQANAANLTPSQIHGLRQRAYATPRDDVIDLDPSDVRVVEHKDL